MGKAKDNKPATAMVMDVPSHPQFDWLLENIYMFVILLHVNSGIEFVVAISYSDFVLL